MASKRLVDVDQTDSFGSFIVIDKETVKQIPKEEVLGQFYTKEQVDDLIPDIPDAPDVSEFIKKNEILPSESTPAGRVLVSRGPGNVSWEDPDTLFANVDSEVF